jgi:hypothetical protein
MGSLTIDELYDAPPAELAARSLSWAAIRGADARLVVAVPSTEAIVLGAFQRRSELLPLGPDDAALPVYRRGSGGAAARVGPGTVWVQLALARLDALVPCTADKLLNRYVRPLLRALGRVTSRPVHYFGRDWISAAHRPVALVAFAHDASSGEASFEALVAVRMPFALRERASFMGKEPATLDEIAGTPIDGTAVAGAIASAYRALASDVREAAPPPIALAEPLLADDHAWSAVREEAIGIVACGRDASERLRVGGELMVSRDAVARLEDRIAALGSGATADDVGRAVDEAFTTRGAVLFGVRSLASIRDVVVAALEATTSGR